MKIGKIQINTTKLAFGTFCAACAWFGASVYSLIDGWLMPRYRRGYLAGREDACNELLTKLEELRDDLKEEREKVEKLEEEKKVE